MDQTTPRIAIISQGLGRIEPPHAHGSIATWTFETVRHLARTHSVLAIEFGKDDFRGRRLEHEGVEYRYVPNGFNRVLNKLHQIGTRLTSPFTSAETRLRRPDYASVFHNLGYIILAAWEARRWGADLIHIHNFSNFVPVVRLFNPRARIAIHMNCEWLSQHDPGLIGPRVRKADAVFCCSGHVMRRFLGNFPDARDKAHIIYNGSNTDRFAPDQSATPSADQPRRILFVGRISPEKGVHHIAEAFAKVAARFPDVILDIVGGAGSLPPDMLVNLSSDPWVQKLAAFNNVDYLAEVKKRIPAEFASRVIFHGNVNHQQLAVHYRNAAFFISASLSDAFPLTVVEAMAAGLPVVGTTVGGIPEQVADQRTGLLVPPDAVDQLAEAMIQMLESPETRRQMSLASRERAVDLFSWSAISNQVAKVYSKVLETAPSNGARVRA